MTRVKSDAEDLLLEHVRLLSAEAPSLPPQGRLAEQVEPALVDLLVRALRVRRAVPRGARRL
jgi:hypothetical protein